MKKLLISTFLVAATAGFSFAQETMSPPSASGDLSAPPATETPAPADTESTPVEPMAPDAITNPDLETDLLESEPARATVVDGFSPMATEAVTSETLEGADVYSGNESIGSVSELVLAPAGAVTEVIVDVGGFLGIGAKSVALSLDELQLLQQDDGDEMRAYTTMTREQIEALPEYEG